MPKGIQLLREGENVFPRPYFAVGSIYISTVETSPASIYGGSWEQIKDTFLLACGDSFAAGTNGGEATHTLAISELPAHSHTVTINSPTASVSSAGFTTAYGASRSDRAYYTQALDTSNSGSGSSHNNMPPYLSVYMWRRVS